MSIFLIQFVESTDIALYSQLLVGINKMYSSLFIQKRHFIFLSS